VKIEVLTFEGCPNAHVVRELVERVLADSQVDAEVAHVNIADAETAQRLRFLGSPTIRIDGKDIEPGAEERTDYAFACRIYRTARGTAGTPDERWLRDALGLP
jgi:Thioredoxin domain